MTEPTPRVIASKSEAPEDMLGQLVVAESTQRDVFGIGTAIAYSDQPTYEIEFENGRRIMSLASLTRKPTAAEAVTYWRKRAMAAEAKVNQQSGAITINTEQGYDRDQIAKHLLRATRS